VLGFVGSSGKGATPIPITIEEYARVSGEGENVVDTTAVDTMVPSDETTSSTTEEVKISYSTNVKVNQSIDIFEGSFAGMVGEVKALNNDKGMATVAIDFFGRSQEVEIPYNQFKLSV
jgi:transcriptional antiterminator NusG